MHKIHGIAVRNMPPVDGRTTFTRGSPSSLTPLSPKGSYKMNLVPGCDPPSRHLVGSRSTAHSWCVEVLVEIDNPQDTSRCLFASSPQEGPRSLALRCRAIAIDEEAGDKAVIARKCIMFPKWSRVQRPLYHQLAEDSTQSAPLNAWYQFFKPHSVARAKRAIFIPTTIITERQ